MALSRTAATKNLALNAEYDQLNSGKIKIYSGSVPATADTALGAQVLLATPLFGATAFAAASGGVKTANAITAANAGVTGTASFFRVTKSDDTVVAQGAVAVSGGQLNLVTLALVAGQPVSVSSLVFTAGA